MVVIDLAPQEKVEPLFDNPFSIADLVVFDDEAMHALFTYNGFGLATEQLAGALQGAPEPLLQTIRRTMPYDQRTTFMEAFRYPPSYAQVMIDQRKLLDNLFWELTYWKTPELYEELTAGEQLHPGIFQHLEPEIANSVVLDVGAGGGRATLQCLRYGARRVYAVEPSPGLRRILRQKLSRYADAQRLIVQDGRFSALPLPDRSIDVTLSCSAFTVHAQQGGEPGLAELQRVTKRGGIIVLIWPRMQDHAWLLEHGFTYVSLPIEQEMGVHFRSFRAAVTCAERFYAHNRSVAQYIQRSRKAEVPFSVLGINPPCDYCWLRVE